MRLSDQILSSFLKQMIVIHQRPNYVVAKFFCNRREKKKKSVVYRYHYCRMARKLLLFLSRLMRDVKVINYTVLFFSMLFLNLAEWFYSKKVNEDDERNHPWSISIYKKPRPVTECTKSKLPRSPSRWRWESHQALSGSHLADLKKIFPRQSQARLFN